MANSGIVVLGVVLTLLVLVERSASQFPIPPRYDGFEYRPNITFNEILVEAFFDPLCPDSRDSWPPLKEALYHYKERVGLIVHPFALPLDDARTVVSEPCGYRVDVGRQMVNIFAQDLEAVRCILPLSKQGQGQGQGQGSYHYNSFLASRSLHIANRWNTSSTFPLLERFFKFQEKFYNNETLNVTPASIIQKIILLATKKLGASSLSAFEDGFHDRATDIATRISFKYGCSRAVTGTPYFFVNGIPLISGDETYDYKKWRSIIDPLLVGHINA